MGCKVKYEGKTIEFSELVDIYARKIGLNTNQLHLTINEMRGEMSEEEIGTKMVEELSFSRDQGFVNDKSYEVNPETRSFSRIKSADTSSVTGFYKSLFGEGKYVWLMNLADRAGVTVQEGSTGTMHAVGMHKKGKITISAAAARFLQTRGLYSYQSLEYTLAHEALHGILRNLPSDQRAQLESKLNAFFSDLVNRRAPNPHVARILRVIANDGIEELITYAFTDKVFSQWLASLPSDTKGTGESDNMWRRLARIIASALEYITGRSKMDELVDIMEASVFPYDLTPTQRIVDAQDAQFEQIFSDRVLTEPQTRKMSFSGTAEHIVEMGADYKKGDEIVVTLGRSGIAETVVVDAVEELNFSNMTRKERDAFAKEFGNFVNISEMLNFFRFYNSKFDKRFEEPIEQMITDDKPVKKIRIRLKDKDSAMLRDVQDRLRQYHESRGKYDQVLDEILAAIQTDIESLESITFKTNEQSERLGRLRKIRRNLTSVRDMEDIADQILQDLKMAEELFDRIKRENISIREKASILHSYSVISKTYSPLIENLGSEKEVRKLIDNASATLGDPENVFSKLNEILSRQRSMRQRFREEGVELMADYLFPIVSQQGMKAADDFLNNRMARWDQMIDEAEDEDNRSRYENMLQKQLQKWSRVQLSRDKIRDMLKVLEKDTNLFDAWVGEAIQSMDPALALFFKDFTANLNEEVALLRSDGDRIEAAFNAFVKETKKSKLNPEKLHEGLYEEIPDKQNGYQKRLSFVQPYRLDEYYEELREFRKTLATAGPKEYARAMQVWHSKNSAPISKKTIDAEIKKVRELVSRGEWDNEALKDWISARMSPKMAEKHGFTKEEHGQSVFRTDKGSYRGPFLRPADQYLSEKWTSLYRDENGEWIPKNALGEYHKALTDYYLELQENLPANMRPGLFVYAAKRRGSEIVITEGSRTNVFKGIWEAFKENLSEKTRVDADEEQYGAGHLFGDGAQIIPMYGTGYEDPDKVSKNLTESVLTFGREIRKYRARTKSAPIALVLEDIISERKVKTTAGGITDLVNRAAAKFGKRMVHEKPQYARRAYLQFHDLTRMMIFGEMRKKWETDLGGLLNKPIMGDKIVDALMGWTAFSSLGFSMSKAFTNWGTAKAQNFIDTSFLSKVDPDISAENLVWAEGYFMKNFKDIFFTDFDKVSNQNKKWINQVIDRFQFMQDVYVDQFGKRISKPTWLNVWEQGIAFFGMRAGEINAAVTYGLAYLRDTKVKKGDTEISLWDALQEDENGNLKIDPDIKWDEQQVIDTIHGRLRNAHGNYSKLTTSSRYSQYAGGRAVGFFRKFLHPGWRRRFYGARYNYETQMPDEGYYVSLMDYMKRNLLNYKMKLQQWDYLDDFEKRNVIKARNEFVFASGMAIMSALLMSAADANDIEDEPFTEGWLFWHLTYIQTRMMHESWTFLNPREYIRIIDDPMIVIKQLVKIIDLASEFVPFAGYNRYEQDSGVWEKGELKMKAKAAKLLGYTGETIAPKQALLNYESVFR